MFSSWFISPWQAARMSFEAQRDMALSFLRLAAGDIASRADTGRMVEPRTAEQNDIVTAPATTPATPPHAQTMASRRASGAASKKRAPSKTKKRSRPKQKKQKPVDDC